MTTPRSVCVFSASSDALAPAYYDVASELGERLGRRGWTLVFGGGTQGLMGAMARAVHAHGGRVVGVIPRKLNQPGIVYEAADELIETDSLRERKAEMDRLADAFVALPGGFGTLEEILEAITLKQLQYHARPAVFLNTQGFYDHLLAFFDHLAAERFVKDEHRLLYHVAAEPLEVLNHIERYVAQELPGKYS